MAFSYEFPIICWFGLGKMTRRGEQFDDFLNWTVNADAVSYHELESGDVSLCSHAYYLVL